MTRLIKLAPNLHLPVDAATETFAILARKDGGKTYAGLKAFEEMYAAGAQCVAIDPVGKWWSLRLAADGHSDGLDVPIFGGLKGDLPLEPTGGALVAQVIVERNLSAVLDVSLFEDRELKRFVTDFAKELYRLKQRKQTVMHLFVEEASTFCPQDKEDGSDPPMLNAMKKIVRKGRNYGIGVTLIDQRAQDVNKKVLNQSSILIVLGTSGTTDRDAIEKWVRDKHIDASGLDELASLGQGDAFVWLPREKVFRQVHIGKRWTFDASATPKVGAKRAEQKLTPMDMTSLRQAMAATVEKAEAEDPKALKAKLAELEKRLRAANDYAARMEKKVTSGSLKAAHRDETAELREMKRNLARLEEDNRRLVAELALRPKLVERAVVKTEQVARLERVGQHLKNVALDVERHATTLIEQVAQAQRSGEALAIQHPPLAAHVARMKKNGHTAPLVSDGALSYDPEVLVDRVHHGRRERPLVDVPPVFENGAPPTGDKQPTSFQREILNALAWWNTIGVAAPSRRQLALLLKKAAKSSYLRNNLGALRTAGLVSFPEAAQVALTEEGQALAVAPAQPPTRAELHAAIREVLNAFQRQIFDLLVEHGSPTPFARTYLADLLHKEVKSSYLRNNLGAMRTAGVVEFPRDGVVQASSLVFPEGLS